MGIVHHRFFKDSFSVREDTEQESQLSLESTLGELTLCQAEIDVRFFARSGPPPLRVG